MQILIGLAYRIEVFDLKSIRFKIIALLLCCVMLSSLVVGIICIAQTQAILKSNAQNNMILLCEKSARSLNLTISNIQTSIDTLAHYITENLTSTDILLDENTEEYAQYLAKISQVGTNHASSLEKTMSVYAVFDPVKFGENKGFYFEADSNGAWVAKPVQDFTQGNAYLNQNWWKQPVSTKEAAWINRFNENDNSLHISYVVPIYQNNVLLGVIGMDFPGEILDSIASEIHLMESGFAVILDRNGKIISHPSLPQGALLALQGEEFDPINEQFDKQINLKFDAGKYDIDQALCKSIFPYEHNDTRHFITFCTLRNGMVLALNAPIDEIYEQQDVMVSRIIGIIIITALAVLLVAIVFANHMTTPIVTLNKATRAFTEGDFDTPVTPKTKDEIGQLAESVEITRVRMKSYIDELYAEAHIDSLTGTHNKSAYMAEEKRINEQIANGTASFSVATFDVNYLKMTNDLLGHISGDELLVKVAACLKNAFGPQNVFRTGGDEFAALIYGEQEGDRMYRLTQCIDEIKQQSFVEYPDIPISCSYGVATFDPELDKVLADTYNRADIMMYQNKAVFKKSVPFWNTELNSMRDTRIKRYLEFLSILSLTMEAHLFLLDIINDKIWLFNNLNRRFPAPGGDYITCPLDEILETVHPEDRDALRNDIEKVVRGEKSEHNLNYRWINEDGTHVWVNGHGKVVNAANGKPSLILGRVSDTILRKWYNQSTGLFNQNKFVSDYKKQTVVPFKSFVLINIDNLSRINLNRGRQAGDEAMLNLANVLTERFSYKVLYHMNKDHFALLLDTQDKQEISALVKSLQEDLEDSLSISVAVVPNEKQYYVDADSIYEYARHLLKTNKDKGEGTISFFTEKDFEKTISDIRLIEEMEESVYENNFEGFYLYYQPQIDAKTHKVVSSEALLRYKSPTKGIVYPNNFIPLLERTQMIREVGMWVLDTALAQCVQWRKTIPNMGVSVNFSPIQLQQEDIAEKLLNTIVKHGLPANALTIELTECIELEESLQYSECFAKLRQAGVHVAIDDFGTGYSNLSYLKKIQADQIKIDQIFVRDLRPGTLNFTLIKNVVQFAKSNGINICMEGVETVEELSALELIGSDKLQGYLFNKPLLQEEFAAKYVDSEASGVWSFDEELAKQREHMRFARFDTAHLLAQTRIGLWLLHYDNQSGENHMYINEIARQLLGIEDLPSNRDCCEYFFARIPDEERPNVLQMIENMRSSENVVQLEFNWNHPTRGLLALRCSGKFNGMQNNVSMFEGLLRIVQDQYLVKNK